MDIILYIQENNTQKLRVTSSTSGDELKNQVAADVNLHRMLFDLKHGEKFIEDKEIIMNLAEGDSMEVRMAPSEMALAMKLLKSEGFSGSDIVDETALLLVTKKSKRHLIKTFIDAGINPDATNSKNGTLLGMMIEKCEVDIVEHILRKGGDPNLLTGRKLSLPIRVAYERRNLEMCELLLKYKSRTEIRRSTPESRVLYWSALQHAASDNDVQMAKLFVKYGADIHSKDSRDRTPLHFALRHDADDVAAYLIECKSDLTVIDNTGYTPLMVALARNNFKVATLLVNAGADPEAVFQNGKSSVFYAVKAGVKELVSALLKAGASADASFASFSTVSVAAKDGDLEILKLLFEYNASNNTPDNEGATPLILAASNGYVNCCEALIKSGVNPSTPGPTGRTAINCAASNCFYDVCQLLIDNGVDKSQLTDDQIVNMNTFVGTPTASNTAFR